MGKDFWLGEGAGPKYKAPAYDLTGVNKLGGRAGLLGENWGGRMGQEAERAGELDAGGYWGEQQKRFGGQLAAAASGAAPSAAELQMPAGLGRAQASAQSLAASARGMSPGLSRYLAGRQMGEQQANITSQTGIMRADEMARAREAYGQFMGGARGQDMASIQLQEQLKQQYLSMGMTAEQAALQAQMEMERQRQQAWATQQGVTAQSVTPGTPGFIANAGVAAAQAGAASLSDRRQKKDIKPADDKALEKFADALEGYSFSYKDDAPTSDRSKKKKHWGVMAQDLEKKGGAVGKSVVDTHEEGGFPAQKAEPSREVKMLDTQATLGAALAAIGNIHGRLKALED